MVFPIFHARAKKTANYLSRTYSFHQLAPEELNVCKEDGWRYPENLHTFWLIYLEEVVTNMLILNPKSYWCRTDLFADDFFSHLFKSIALGISKQFLLNMDDVKTV